MHSLKEHFHRFKHKLSNDLVRLEVSLWEGNYGKIDKPVYWLLTKIYGYCSHYPIFGNRRPWLRNLVTEQRGHEWWNISTCVICGHVDETKQYAGRIDTDTQEMKDQRQEYFKSTLQPSRDGVASREFIEAYPETAKRMFTKDQIKKSKEVWKDLPGHSNWKKSK